MLLFRIIFVCTILYDDAIAKKNPLSALELITDFLVARFSQAIINPLPSSGQ
jgi:hypothetical protein